MNAPGLKPPPAKESIARIHNILNMPSREARRWKAAQQHERIAVLLVAGVPRSRENKSWEQIAEVEQGAINRSFSRLSDLARYKRVS